MSKPQRTIVDRFETALTALIDVEQQGATPVFKAAARGLGDALDFRWTGIGTFNEMTDSIDLKAFYENGKFTDCFSYPIIGTPCAEVYGRRETCFFEDVAAIFPEDEWLQQIGAKAYHGALIRDGEKILGHVFAIDDSPSVPHEFSQSLVALTARWAEKEIRYHNILERACKAEESAMKARHAAEEASAAKSRFLSNMSHELRTPMNAIMGFAQIIEANCTGLEQAAYREYASDIVLSGNRMIKLIDEILEYARFQNETAGISIREIDAVETLSGIVAGYPEQPDSGRIVTAFPGKTVMVNADPDRLAQVIEHLISNALKFSPADSAINVRLLENDNRTVSIRVQDNGPGFSKEMEQKIFEPFFRGGDPMVSGRSGSGLGLATCRQIVKAMRGSVSLSCMQGKGCCAEVVLPQS